MSKPNRILLVGGGSGSAPLALLAKHFATQVEEVSVVLGAPTASRLILADRFSAFGCKLHTATDDGSRGNAGNAVETAMPLIHSGTVDSVYACGPEDMLISLARLCIGARMPCQVSLERYMRCGMGLCGSCHYGDLLVCRDGPVVEARRWLEAISS